MPCYRAADLEEECFGHTGSDWQTSIGVFVLRVKLVYVERTTGIGEGGYTDRVVSRWC